MSETEQEETQRPLTIAMVVDTSGNRGNGTSNSALQWAEELKRQGHTVRLVGIGAPEYPARVNHVPLVSWVAKQQQMQFAEPSDTLFRTAFQGVDVVHIYTPFRFGQHACKVAKQMGIAVTAGYHVQPENITYSAGPLKYIPGIDSFIYWLFQRIRSAIHSENAARCREVRAGSVPYRCFRTIDERKESCCVDSGDRALQACARY